MAARGVLRSPGLSRPLPPPPSFPSFPVPSAAPAAATVTHGYYSTMAGRSLSTSLEASFAANASAPASPALIPTAAGNGALAAIGASPILAPRSAPTSTSRLGTRAADPAVNALGLPIVPISASARAAGGGSPALHRAPYTKSPAKGGDP